METAFDAYRPPERPSLVENCGNPETQRQEMPGNVDDVIAWRQAWRREERQSAQMEESGSSSSRQKGQKRQRQPSSPLRYIRMSDLENAGRTSAYRFYRSEESGTEDMDELGMRPVSRRRRLSSTNESESRRSRSSTRSIDSERGDDSEQSSTSREHRVARRLAEEEKKKLKDLVRAQEACVGCTITRKNTEKIDSTDLHLIEDFFVKMYGKMSNDALFAIMHKLYEHIREKYKRRGRPIFLPEWPKEIIQEHYLFHIMDGQIIINEGLRKLYVMFSQMTDSCMYMQKEVHRVEGMMAIDAETGEPSVYEYDTYRPVPNNKNIRCTLEVMKMIVHLLKLSGSDLAPERMRKLIKDLRPSSFPNDRINFL